MICKGRQKYVVTCTCMSSISLIKLRHIQVLHLHSHSNHVAQQGHQRMLLLPLLVIQLLKSASTVNPQKREFQRRTSSMCTMTMMVCDLQAFACSSKIRLHFIVFFVVLSFFSDSVAVRLPGHTFMSLTGIN